jgi:hypothetical protein
LKKPEKREKPENEKKKTEKTGKNWGKTGKGSKNIKACPIENALKLVTPRSDFHNFFRRERSCIT